jgi:prophage DNA circulation protein
MISENRRNTILISAENSRDMGVNTKSDKKADLNVLEQVLKTFLNIDKRILDLHKCSSDDFLSLNKTLKLNHQKATIITESVTTAFEKIGPEGNLNNLLMLKASLEELITDIVSFESEINSNLDILERIQANFSLMFVPINNFRQNLTSLKLLLSNLKLTNNLYNHNLKNFSEAEATKIESVINKVKESCPVFEENIYVIQKHLKTLYKDLSDFKELIFKESMHKLKILLSDFEIIERNNKEVLAEKGTIDKISQNCKSSVGSIITNLQYHDIIRQKMEHIQQTHKLIINEIHDNNGSENQPSQSSSNPFFLQIPQIIEIQTAQLLHTNKDYQNAINHISKKMIEIGHDMAAIARICKTLGIFEYKGRRISRETTGQIFEKLLADKKQGIEKFRNLSDDVNLIQRIVNNLFDRFKDLEMIENSIEQTIIEKISFANLLVSEEQETASQAQQILKLYADNHFEKNKIRTLFNNTTQQLKDYVRANSLFVHDRKGIDSINHNLEVANKNFKEVMTNIGFLESMQHDIEAKSIEIEKASNEVVSQVKYYDFFEKTIDELIHKFESINMLIKDHGQGYFDQVDRKKGLEQIAKYYTMKSERIIHKNSLVNLGLATKGEHTDENDENTSMDQDGNDVEFF